jgi:hypothetical protein
VRLPGPSHDRLVPAVARQDTGPGTCGRSAREGGHGSDVRTLCARAVTVDPSVARKPLPTQRLQRRLVGLLQRRLGQRDRPIELTGQVGGLRGTGQQLAAAAGRRRIRGRQRVEVCDRSLEVAVRLGGRMHPLGPRSGSQAGVCGFGGLVGRSPVVRQYRRIHLVSGQNLRHPPMQRSACATGTAPYTASRRSS